MKVKLGDDSDNCNSKGDIDDDVSYSTDDDNNINS